MADDYKVGYRKPPPAGRFKKGQSGNPKGRTKGHKNLKSIIEGVLAKPVSITERGKRRTIPAIEAMLLETMADALKRDPKARALMTNLALQSDAQAPPEATPNAAKDNEVMQRLIARLRRQPGSGEEK